VGVICGVGVMWGGEVGEVGWGWGEHGKSMCLKGKWTSSRKYSLHCDTDDQGVIPYDKLV
jgi:hypothetical protein